MQEETGNPSPLCLLNLFLTLPAPPFSPLKTDYNLSWNSQHAAPPSRLQRELSSNILSHHMGQSTRESHPSMSWPLHAFCLILDCSGSPPVERGPNKDHICSVWYDLLCMWTHVCVPPMKLWTHRGFHFVFSWSRPCLLCINTHWCLMDGCVDGWTGEWVY